jgi:putative transposase
MKEPNLRKTYKEQLRPTPTQERALDAVLWRCRTLDNTALEQRIAAWERCHVSVSRFAQEAALKAIRAEFPDYAALHSHVLQDVMARLVTAYQAFFRRLANGEKPGFPRFQGRSRYHSLAYKEYGNGARLDDGFLVFSKLGRIAVRWSRPLQGTPKTVTLGKEADRWYVSFSYAEVPARPLPPAGKETGLDVGLQVFLIAADGKRVANPRHHRRDEKRLAKAQRRVSRRQRGGHRRRKAVACLARAHQTVQRQRADFHHKTALALPRAYDTLYLEDLRGANLLRNRHLAKGISDAGWARFRAIREAKAACAGREVVAVPPAYTGQDCSGCGERVPKSLRVRTHVCPTCGLVLDRDEHAARNIQGRGQRLRGLAEVSAGMNREPMGL